MDLKSILKLRPHEKWLLDDLESVFGSKMLFNVKIDQ